MSLSQNAGSSASSPFDIPDNASLSDVIKYLQSLQELFANHNHDGINSQSLVSLLLQALSVSQLDIPNTSATDSFHVDSMGNTWWGAPLLVNSIASILKDGTATFKNISANTAVLTVQLVGGGGSTIRNANVNARGIPHPQVTPLKLKTLTCNVKGLYTLNFTGLSPGDPGSATFYLFKNGVSITSITVSGAGVGNFARSFGDVFCNAGDVFDIYGTNDRGSQGVDLDSFFVLGQIGFGTVISGTIYGFIPTLTTGSFGSPAATNWTITLD